MHILLKCAWAFSRINHMLAHKTKLKKLRGTEVNPSNSSCHHGVIPEINGKKKTGKFTNIWRLNNKLLNNIGEKEI